MNDATIAKGLTKMGSKEKKGSVSVGFSNTGAHQRPDDKCPSSDLPLSPHNQLALMNVLLEEQAKPTAEKFTKFPFCRFLNQRAKPGAQHQTVKAKYRRLRDLTETPLQSLL